MLNGIFWIARSGAAWRDLPERYGPWQTVYKRLKEWTESGLIGKILHELCEDADLQDISIDSTSEEALRPLTKVRQRSLLCKSVKNQKEKRGATSNIYSNKCWR